MSYQLPPMPKPADYGYDPAASMGNGNFEAKLAYERALEVWKDAIQSLANAK